MAAAGRADLEHRSIPRMAIDSAERYGDALAVLDGAAALTFGDVEAQMMAVARALMARGVGGGDRVALWAPNSAAWITNALGILAVGARLVPLNTRFKGDEAAYVLRRSDARLLLHGEVLDLDLLGMIEQADPELAIRRRAVRIGDDAFMAAGDSVAEKVVRDRIDAIRPEDPSDVIFTSGTTGRPKGVVLRHGTSLRCYQRLNEACRLGPGHRMLVVTPFFHCFGYKAGWMMALMSGAVTVPMAVFDAGAVLAAIEELRITHTAGSPTMFWALLDHPRRHRTDLSSLQVASVSAAYVPVELVHRMVADLGIERPLTGYGLTEAHAIVAVSRPDDGPDEVASWSGQVLEDVEVRLVDDDGHDVALGERGELLVRGHNLMDGYYDDPAATAQVIDAEGWLHTGDIAYMNADRYIKVCDRKKDMYVTGGFNVAPAEVEGVLAECEEVSMCAVIGVADRYWGEVGVAFVVPTPGADVTPDDVIAHATRHLAKFKVPRRVEIVDALPLNATGKVQKNELRAIADHHGGPRPE
jgi:acyl-CoA synthetase (AMP-forming)/AMP-acid ligase II